jgi:hypothetical protein
MPPQSALSWLGGAGFVARSRSDRSRGRVGSRAGDMSSRSLAKKHVRQPPIIPSHGSPEADGDARNGGPLRKWSCGGGSCRRSAHNDRANDERTDHHDRDDDIDDDEYGNGDYDEHGDDDYHCGDHDDDGGGAADLDNYRLVSASEGDSYSRSPSWGKSVRCAVREGASGASAS